MSRNYPQVIECKSGLEQLLDAAVEAGGVDAARGSFGFEEGRKNVKSNIGNLPTGEVRELGKVQQLFSSEEYLQAYGELRTILIRKEKKFDKVVNHDGFGKFSTYNSNL